MELRKNWRKLNAALSRFWHREAGPMNWKNPVRVTAYIGWEIFNGVAFLVGEWVRYGVRASQIFLAIPPTVILFCGGGWFAVWSFVRLPFPALETVPLLDLLEYHNPNFTAPDRGKPLAFGVCHAGVLELALAPRNRTALYSLLTLARWFPLIHR